VNASKNLDKLPRAVAKTRPNKEDLVSNPPNKPPHVTHNIQHSNGYMALLTRKSCGYVNPSHMCRPNVPCKKKLHINKRLKANEG
jgi:hypothetical protein